MNENQSATSLPDLSADSMSAELGPGTTKPRNPFPGLRPYQMNDSDLFFGREDQIHELLSRLRRERFLAVLGDSGSGKSSLIRAGLLPRLKAGFMVSDPDGWRIAIMTPGDDPIRRLSTALCSPDALLLGENAAQADLQTSLCHATLNRGSNGLVDVVRESHLPDGFRLLVLVDQFEELFRFGSQSRGEPPSTAARNFVRLLLEAAAQRDIPIYVSITMRSEYLGHCAPYLGLPEAINDGLYLVSRMTREQLRDAICEPIAKCRGQVSNRLVNRLINDLGDQSDQLPVLQHALMRLWSLDPSQPATLDLEDLEAERIGGLASALPKHVVEILDSLEESERFIAQDVFRSLTQVDQNGNFVRRPTELSEICELANAGQEKVLRVINQFRKEGRSFLTPSEHETLTASDKVDISHESLIRQWQDLRDWTLDEHKSREVKQWLQKEARKWDNNGRGNAEEVKFLLTGVQLEEALEWRTKRPLEIQRPQFRLEREFLNRSERGRLDEQKRQLVAKRTRMQLGIISSVLALALGVLIWSGLKYRVSTQNLAKAQQQTEQATEESKRAKVETGVADAAKKVADADKKEAEKRVRVSSAVRLAAESRRVASDRPVSRLLLSFEAIRATRQAGELASPDAVAAYQEAQQSLSPLGITSQVLWSHDGAARALTVNNDKQLIASGGADRMVRIWSAKTNGKPTELRDHVSPITTVAISINGNWLFSGSEDGEVFARELADGRPAGHSVRLGRLSGRVTDIECSRDSEWVVVGSRDQAVRAWDLKALAEKPEGTELSGHQGSIVDIAAFELNGAQWVVTGSSDRTARVWNLSKLRTPGSLPQSTVLQCSNPVSDVAIGDNGKLEQDPVIAVCAETISLWSTKDAALKEGAAPMVLASDTKANERFDAVSFSPNGDFLLSRGFLYRTNQPKISRWPTIASNLKWDRPPNMDPVESPGPSSVRSFWDVPSMVMQSPDGRWLVASRSDGSIQLQAVTKYEGSSIPILLSGHDGPLTRLAFRSVNTKTWQLVSSGSDGTVRLWNLSKHAFVDQLLPVYSNRQFQGDSGAIVALIWRDWREDKHRTELFDLSRERRLVPVNTKEPSQVGQLSSLTMDILQEQNQLRALAIAEKGLWLIPILRSDETRTDATASETPTARKPQQLDVAPPMLVATNSQAPWVAATFRESLNSDKLVIRVFRLPGNEISDQAKPPTSLLIRSVPSSISVMSLSSDGKWLAAFSDDDRALWLWDLSTFLPLTGDSASQQQTIADPVVVKRLAGGLRSLRFTPNSRRLIAITYRGTVQNWGVDSLRIETEEKTGDSIASLDALRLSSQTAFVGNYSNATAMDDRWLVKGNDDNGLDLWDLDRQDARMPDTTLTGLSTASSLTAISLSPDQRWCVAGTSNGAVCLWDMKKAIQNPTGSHEPTMRVVGHGSQIAKVYFQDSETIFTVDRFGMICRWPLSALPRNLDLDWAVQQKQAADLIGRNLTEIEWKTYFKPVGEEDYHETFPELRVHSSVLDAAIRSAGSEAVTAKAMEKLTKLIKDDEPNDPQGDADKMLNYERAVALASDGQIEKAAIRFQKADPNRLTTSSRLAKSSSTEEAQRFAINHLMSEAVEQARKGNPSSETSLRKLEQFDPAAGRVALARIRNLKMSALSQKIYQLLWQLGGSSAGIDDVIKDVQALQELLKQQKNDPLRDQVVANLWSHAERLAAAETAQMESAKRLIEASQKLVARPGVFDVQRRLNVIAAAKTLREAENLVKQDKDSDAIKQLEALQMRPWIQTPQAIVNVYRAARLVTEAVELAKQPDKRESAIKKLDEAKSLDPRYASDSNAFVDRITARQLLNEAMRTGSEDEKARDQFRQAIKLEPRSKLDPDKGLYDLLREVRDPQSTLRKLQVALQVTPGIPNRISGADLRQAVQDAKKLDLLVARALIDAQSWNLMCWVGCLEGMATEVAFAGEIAVELSPVDGLISDTRGLARALTGDGPGARSDFDYYALTSENFARSAERADWAQALRSGKTPKEIFTPELLALLKGQ